MVLLIESKKMEKGNETETNRVFEALPLRALSGPPGKRDACLLVLHHGWPSAISYRNLYIFKKYSRLSFFKIQ
jgi:hypothetical protein